MTLKSDGSHTLSGFRFAVEFLRNPLKTGAVAASSPALINALVNQVDFERSRSIVELGPGTGVITEALVKEIKGDTHFFALELNPTFAEQTRNRCPGTTVEVGCATTLAKRLQAFGIDQCDCVVSALPWTLFDGETQDSLLGSIRESLSDTGSFVFYTYRGTGFMPAAIRLRRYLKKHFSSVQHVSTAWRNLPPAAVYICRP